jgi:hypoxanthine phosphoribosyltransferase
MKMKALREEDYNSIITVNENGVYDASLGESAVTEIIEILKRDKRIEQLLIPDLCIEKRIGALAREIHNDFSQSDQLNILVVLTGAFMFAADMGRALYSHYGMKAIYHLIKTSVYDKKIKETNEEYRAVQLELAPKNIEGKDILLIEDITDQGFTLTWLLNYLKQERGVNSVKTCSLLNKILTAPSAEVKELRKNLNVDYIGFNIPDVWVAGYGVDAGHDFRNLPFIISVDESYYL